MKSDQELSKELETCRRTAQETLWREMTQLGLFSADGWQLVETTRDRDGRTEIVLRPLHRVLTSPEHLECVVWISNDGEETGTRCES